MWFWCNLISFHHQYYSYSIMANAHADQSGYFWLINIFYLNWLSRALTLRKKPFYTEITRDDKSQNRISNTVFVLTSNINRHIRKRGRKKDHKILSKIGNSWPKLMKIHNKPLWLQTCDAFILKLSKWELLIGFMRVRCRLSIAHCPYIAMFVETLPST